MTMPFNTDGFFKSIVTSFARMIAEALVSDEQFVSDIALKIAVLHNDDARLNEKINEKIIEHMQVDVRFIDRITGLVADRMDLEETIDDRLQELTVDADNVKNLDEHIVYTVKNMSFSVEVSD